MQNLLTEVLARHKPRVLFAYLFGSTGTELEHPRSDLDLAVYFQAQPGEITLEHKLDLYTSLSRALQRNQIDIVVLNTCRNYMLLYQILIQGRVIYDQEPETRALYEQQTMHAAIDFKQQRDRIFS